MAWIRLDDQIAHHPKFIRAGLSSWLWVGCVGFAQKFLTDGHIPYGAIATLCGGVDRPQNHINKLVSCGLLECVEDGYQVHDYLDFNDSAETVKAKRLQDRIRKESGRNPVGIRSESGRNPKSVLARAPASHPIPSHPTKILDPNNEIISNACASSNGNGNGPAVRQAGELDSGPKDADAERAGRLVEHYGELFQVHRHGARHRQRPVLDFQDACQLVQLWTDQRLEKLAVIVLTTDDVWIAGTDRGFKIFALKASWADDRLTQWEREHGVSTS